MKKKQHYSRRKSCFIIFFLILLSAIIWWIWKLNRMPGHSYQKPLKPLTAEQINIRNQVKQIVYQLSHHIGERNILHYQQLEDAALYIKHQFEKYGYKVHIQSYQSQGKTVKNIEVILPGDKKSKQIIVIGAHYDTVKGSPGADDNASGVAALLEIARLLKQKHLDRTVHFVAFTNEEPPFFYTKEMGSYHYAKKLKQKKTHLLGMISLDCLGVYSNKKNSQHYPILLNLFYPNRANFIAFVGNLMSYKLVHQFIKGFRAHAQFPSEGVVLPIFIKGVAWSDHLSFWEQGYKAMMVTDTAFYRYPYYHTPFDTPQRIDYARLARVVMGLADSTVILAKEYV